MNEIIVKLAEQAAEHAVLNPSDSVLQSEVDGSKVEIPAEFIEQFSTLLIQECVAFCEQRKLTPSVFVADELLEHFGIKE